MDPTEVLNRVREAILDYEERPLNVGVVCELVEAFKALDEWLTMGGCLPDQWAER